MLVYCFMKITFWLSLTYLFSPSEPLRDIDSVWSGLSILCNPESIPFPTEFLVLLGVELVTVWCLYWNCVIYNESWPST
jgi:hypothetical protein